MKRHGTRLAVAREQGFLDATCAANKSVVEAFGRWCWRLRVPAVWFERKSPRSKFGRLHLTMVTTASELTEEGRRALESLAACATVSKDEACWEDVPRADLRGLARSAFRAATKAGHYGLREREAHRRDRAALRAVA